MKVIPEEDVLLHGSIAEWEKFIANDRSPTGLDIYPDIFHNGILFPLQRMRETEMMIAMARTINPKRVMEIGSDKGGSFYHWVKAFSPEKAIAIEIRGIPFEESFPRAFPDTQFFFAADSSYDPEIVRAVSRFIGPGFLDCIFIDGDKGGFMKDVQSYLPMVRRGGLIFLHDVTEVESAREAMRFCEREYRMRTEVFVDTSEYDEIHRRELSGIPPADAYEGWFRYWKRSSCGVGVIHV